MNLKYVDFKPTNMVLIMKFKHPLNLYYVSQLLTCTNVTESVELDIFKPTFSTNPTNSIASTVSTASTASITNNKSTPQSTPQSTTPIANGLPPLPPVANASVLKKYKEKKLKILFFGTNGIIVSVRFENLSRGVRIGNAQLRNTVAVDLQMDDKNIHIKISKKKMQMSGILSEEMGLRAFELCLGHITMVNEHFKHFYQLSSKTKNSTIEWLKTIFFVGNNRLRMYDDPIILDYFEKCPKCVDYRSARYISMFSYDCKTYNNFNRLIDHFLSFESPNEENNFCYNKIPKLISYSISNSVYTYTLHKSLSLIKITQFLLEQSYKASYHNWHKPKQVEVLIPIDKMSENVYPNGLKELKSKSKGKESKINSDIASECSEKSYSTYIEGDDSDDDLEADEEVDADEGDEDAEFEDLDAEVGDDEEESEDEDDTPTFNDINSSKKIKGHRFHICQTGSIRQNSPSTRLDAFNSMHALVTNISSNFEKFTV